MTPSAAHATSIPREQWSTHPNYPTNLLLLGSHRNFRAINRKLVVRAEAAQHAQEAEVTSPLPALARTYRSWIQAMRSHEAYEEHKLYPYLEARWGVSLADAQAGHRALHDVHAWVCSAFDEHDAESSVAALRRHEQVLGDHLDLEEEHVIPLLLELPREEFARFTHSSIGALLRDLRERGRAHGHDL